MEKYREKGEIATVIMKRDTFSGYHPIINFTYFVLVIGYSMFMMHPVFLALSCMGGMAYYIYLKKWKALKTALWMMLPIFLISAASNPLFNHQGVTLIMYLKNGNPLTLESILYGLAAGIMLVSVLNWLSCDKILFLVLLVFGGMILGGIITKQVYFLYYPALSMNENTLWAAIIYTFYGILCFLPIIINLAEDVKWHYLKSKI